MSNVFTSFDEVAKYLEKPIKELWVAKRTSLREIWKFLRKTIRDKHWHYQSWWKKSRSSPNSPLLKTWELRQAVSFQTTENYVNVYSKKEWLAEIHEYWVTYRMTDKQRRFIMGVVFKDQPKLKWRPRNTWWSWFVTIPARPIWRRILTHKKRDLEDICWKSLENIF